MAKPDWLDRINAAIDENKVDDGMVVELLLAWCSNLTDARKDVLAGYMERECKALPPSDPWKNDKVQFARLLCELVANCADLAHESVATSMDLSFMDLNELYNRADKVWEAAKKERSN